MANEDRMFELLADLTDRPPPFSTYTAPRLWSDPHTAARMLQHHLDPDSALASRPPREIDATVDWLDTTIGLAGKDVCDLGCGPGLYAERFHDRGARVTGVDLSTSSLEHARRSAGRTERDIRYVEADYTTTPLDGRFDLVTLIYCDFCALSPHQRAALLANIATALRQGGHLALDVLTLAAFDGYAVGSSVERNLMHGFWSGGDYVGACCRFKYEQEQVTLDRYLIVEPDRYWYVCNWLQYFPADGLAAELAAAGFRLIARAGPAGAPWQPDQPVMTVVATTG